MLIYVLLILGFKLQGKTFTFFLKQLVFSLTISALNSRVPSWFDEFEL